MKKKNWATKLLFYLCYTAFCCVGNNLLDGAISFGVFVGGLYAGNPIVVAILYVASCFLSGFDFVLQGVVRATVLLVAVFVHKLCKKPIGKLLLVVYCLLANVFYCAHNFSTYFVLFDKLLFVALGTAFALVCVYVFRVLFVRGIAYQPQLDETVCLCLFVVAQTYCLSHLQFGVFEPLLFVVPFLLLFVVCTLGDKHCLLLSVLFGVGNILCTGQLELAMLFVFFAVCCVAFCKINRYVSAISLVIVDVLMCYFFNVHGQFSTLVFVPTTLGCFLFVVVPTKAINYCKDVLLMCGNHHLQNGIVQQMGFNLSKKLYRLSEIFLSMKNCFVAMSVGSISKEQAQVALSRQCCENVCQQCKQRTRCWRNDVAQTEKGFLQLSQCALERGKCTLLDIPQVLTVRCDRLPALVSEINSLAQSYSNYISTTTQRDAGKLLVGEQMGGVSALLAQLAQDCKGKVLFDGQKERQIVQKLVFYNVLCSGAVLLQQNNSLQVVVTIAKKDENKPLIAKIVASVVKQKMTVCHVEEVSDAWENVYLFVTPRFAVEMGLRQVCKHGSALSGDTHSFVKTENGKCIATLCDGMGSGSKAENMSATAIGLVECFYRAGFDNDVVLSCVNNMLTSSGNEVFCAVDVCAIDLYNGLVDFVKLGAPVGMVKSGKEVQIVEGGSLPLGVLEEMTPSITKKALCSGDMVLLATDGLFDCLGGVEAVQSCFAEQTLTNPQSVANALMDKALRACSNKPMDDATICIIKVV